MVNQGEEIWTSANKTNEMLTEYLRKRRVYVNYAQINDFGGPDVLAVRIGSQAWIWKECG